MSNIHRFPGLIDTHVHLREPGSMQKEDFESGTKAAIAGGYTAIIDMPNNPDSIVTPQLLQDKIDRAEGRISCDLGFHFGGALMATTYFNEVKAKVFALKVYMNHTTGNLLIEDDSELDVIFSKWPKEKILMVHAEGETLEKAVSLAKKYGNKLHACHVSLKREIEYIKSLKAEGFPITCEVTAHHLFLNQHDADRLGAYGFMKPNLASQEDVQSLWDNLDTIDIIASDHAPHTKDEKDLGNPPPFGVPGLETTLSLLVNAFHEGKLSLERIQALTHDTPKKLFNVPTQENTYVEVDLDQEFMIKNSDVISKCGWTPFEGMTVKGKIVKVILRGQVVFSDGKIVAPPTGKTMTPVYE
jgi:carbamoyl-phosphate synthase/aspartate carbamoyltransferase/dihydroorotase